jgi:DNA polymerase III alpha subunit (gram-positive type)
MIDMACYKYNLEKITNPIIDTLMLSRVINRDLKNRETKASSEPAAESRS